MKLSILALLATTLLLAGCQKGSPRSVSAKLGAAGDSKASDPDQIIDALIKEDNSKATCLAPFLETHTSLKNVRKDALQFIADHKEQLNAEEQKKAADMSYEIQNKTMLLVTELVNMKVASCGTTDPVRLIDLKDDSNTVIIKLAEKSGKETKESELARKEKKRKTEKLADTKSLVNQKFKLSKDLAANLNEDGKARFVFFMDGIISSSKQKFEEALSQTDKVVCSMQDAPKANLLEGAEFSVLDLESRSTEKKAASPGSEETVKSTTMLIRVSAAEQLFSFSCRLSGNMMQETATKQFKMAFKDLLK